MAIDEGTVYQPELSKIAKNAGISGIGEIIFKILGYITSIVITRTVGSAIFGIFILAHIITNIGHIFSSLGLGEGLLRFVAFYKGREDIPRLKGIIIFSTKAVFLLSLFFTCVAGFLSFFLINLITTKLFPIPVSIFNMAVLSLIHVSLYALFIFLFELGKEDKYILKLIYQELINFKVRIPNARQ